MEHEVLPGVTESLKVMTRTATLRIAQYAFEYAYLNNRKKVTAVHKVGLEHSHLPVSWQLIAH